MRRIGRRRKLSCGLIFKRTTNGGDVDSGIPTPFPPTLQTRGAIKNMDNIIKQFWSPYKEIKMKDGKTIGSQGCYVVSVANCIIAQNPYFDSDSKKVDLIKYLIENYTDGNGLWTNRNASIKYPDNVTTNIQSNVAVGEWKGDLQSYMVRMQYHSLNMFTTENTPGNFKLYFWDVGVGNGAIDGYYPIDGFYDVVAKLPSWEGSFSYLSQISTVQSTLPTTPPITNKEIEYMIGRLELIKNGKKITTANIMHEGKNYVELRDYEESYGNIVDYNDKTKQINVHEVGK